MKKLKSILGLIIVFFILFNFAESKPIRIVVFGEGGVVRDGDITIICPKSNPDKVCAIIEWDMQTYEAKIFDENNKLIEEFEIRTLKTPNGSVIENKQK